MKLTVCITTFDRWHSCIKALQSVCEQKLDDLEVILVDDCSSEPMPKKVRDYVTRKGVLYIRHRRNEGLARARNTALEIAQGEYFSFCDDDDEWPDGLAQKLLNSIRDGLPGVRMAVAIPANQYRACRRLFENDPSLSELMIKGYTPPVSS